jgi:hypothetical protein
MMRPCLKPALRRAWRDRSTLQFGVGPEHGGVLHAGPVEATFLDLLDGTRELPTLAAEATRLGFSAKRVEELMGGLRACDTLDDSNAHHPLLALPSTERARSRCAVPTWLARPWRRYWRPPGVRRVRVRDSGRAQPEDASPASLRADDAGAARRRRPGRDGRGHGRPAHADLPGRRSTP